MFSVLYNKSRKGWFFLLDNQKIAKFISHRRKTLGLTQADVAEILKVSFQAVSKWENGTLPNVEMLVELAKLLQVSVDEILNGEERKNGSYSYSKAVWDTIVCGKAEKETIKSFVKGIWEACIDWK